VPNCESSVSFKLLRMIPGPDRPDYWLGVLDRPLRWIDGDRERVVKHVIVCARWQGTQIRALVQDLPVGLAYVTDATQVDDPSVSFDKCRYLAIGIAHENEGRPAPQGQVRSMAGRIARAFGFGKRE
jgi:hypothetical protein